MHRTKYFALIAVTVAAVATSPAVFAQTGTDRGATTTTETEDNDTDYGWIGLAGLAGLLGLMRRRDSDTVGRTDTVGRHETAGRR